MTFFIRTKEEPDIVEKIEHVVEFDKWYVLDVTDFYVKGPYDTYKKLEARENIISIEVN